MKRIILFAITHLSLVIGAYSQLPDKADSAGVKIKEPEYLDVFFFLDSATGNLVELERQTLKVKFHPHGFGGTESELDLKGEKSSVRFRAGQSLAFIVRVTSHESDPAGSITLYVLQSKKNLRKLEVGKTGYAGTGRKIELDKSMVPLNSTSYGTSSIKLKAVRDLPPGEYLLLTHNANEGFAFGVD